MPSARCQLIGSTSMVVLCAEAIEVAHGEVVGVISDTDTAVTWAVGRHIPVASLAADVGAFLAQAPFDYLFSVVNPVVLPDIVLAMPLVEAINFHDGPLPRYAGCYVTSWAIVNGETQHGVSWHRMTSLVDGGDIFAQAAVPISPRDSAFTLNLKCYDVGIRAFSDLFARLLAGTASAVPQNLARRTYFPADEPPGPALLSWIVSAERTARLVRGLYLGPGRTDVGPAKVLTTTGAVLTVKRCDVLEHASETRPGTVLSLSDGSMSVATSTSDLALGGLQDINGHHVTAADLAQRFAVTPGVRLPSIEQRS